MGEFRRVGNVKLGLGVTENGPNGRRLSLSLPVLSAVGDGSSFVNRSGVSYHGCKLLGNVARYEGLFTSVLNMSTRGIVMNNSSDLGVVFSAVSYFVATPTIRNYGP